MDFDLSKENIQPLRGGRNATQLGTALQAQNDSEYQKELLQQKEEFENTIKSYKGADPLENWYNYISWIEQSYPKHGHEGNLTALLEDCLGKFEHDTRYLQDRRLCKLFIKYIDLQHNPLELFQLLYSRGFGTDCTDLYRAWAYYYEASGDFKRADHIFQLGFQANAQPHEELKSAYDNFTMAVGRHVLRGSADTSHLAEKRRALTSLRSYKHKHRTIVPSQRTGVNVVDYLPGTVKSTVEPSRSNNFPVDIFQDTGEASMPGPSQSTSPSSIKPKSILDSASKHEMVQKENMLKAGPWNNALQKRSGVQSSNLKFTVHEDDAEQEQEKQKQDSHNNSTPTPLQQQQQQPIVINHFNDLDVELFIPEPNNNTKTSQYNINEVYVQTTEYSFEELYANKYLVSKKLMEQQQQQQQHNMYSNYMSTNYENNYQQEQQQTTPSKLCLSVLKVSSPIINSNQQQQQSNVSGDGDRNSNNTTNGVVEQCKSTNTSNLIDAFNSSTTTTTTTTTTNKHLNTPEEVAKAVESISSTTKLWNNINTSSSITTSDVSTPIQQIGDVLPLTIPQPIRNDSITTHTKEAMYEVNNLWADSNQYSYPEQQQQHHQHHHYQQQKQSFQIHEDVIDHHQQQQQQQQDYLIQQQQSFAIYSDNYDYHHQVHQNQHLMSQISHSPHQILSPPPPQQQQQQHHHHNQHQITPPSLHHHNQHQMTSPPPPPPHHHHQHQITQSHHHNQHQHQITTPPPHHHHNQHQITQPHHHHQIQQNYTNQISPHYNNQQSYHHQNTANRLSGGNFDDTMSTQMFNFNLQNTNVSTPYNDRKLQQQQQVYQQHYQQPSSTTTGHYNNNVAAAAAAAAAAVVHSNHNNYQQQHYSPVTVSAVAGTSSSTQLINHHNISTARQELFPQQYSKINVTPIPTQQQLTQPSPSTNSYQNYLQQNQQQQQHYNTIIPPIEQQQQQQHHHHHHQQQQQQQQQQQKLHEEESVDKTNNKLSIILENSKEYRSCSSGSGSSGLTLKSATLATSGRESLPAIKEMSHIGASRDTCGMEYEVGEAMLQLSQEIYLNDEKNDEADYVVNSNSNSNNYSRGSDIYVDQNSKHSTDSYNSPQKDESQEDVMEWDEHSTNSMDYTIGCQNLSAILASDKPVNPFDSKVIDCLLKKARFPNIRHSGYIKIQQIPKISPKETIFLKNDKYSIDKVLGKGTFGTVFKANNLTDGGIVAVKYQKPSNFWEYYISKEIQHRIKDSMLLLSFMDISKSYYCKSSSLFISEFSKYGSLLNVANKVKKVTGRQLKDAVTYHFVVEMIRIVAALHQCQIIHADIKPDNFLVMRLPPDSGGRLSLQLIDFGCSIDMTLFPSDMCFYQVVTTEDFTCTEMREGKPWTYQTDLFCMAATAYVLLMGEYMKVKKEDGVWTVVKRFPRYVNLEVWKPFFRQLLNIESCDNLPDLTQMQAHFQSILNERHGDLTYELRQVANIMNDR